MPAYRAVYVPRLDDDYEDEPGRCAECGGHLGMEGGGGGADACDCGGSFEFESQTALEPGNGLALVAEAEQRLGEQLGQRAGDFCVLEVTPA